MMEKIAIGASIDLVIIIGSTIMLFMICGFIYWRCTSGKWALPLGVSVQTDAFVLYDFRISITSAYLL